MALAKKSPRKRSLDSPNGDNDDEEHDDEDAEDDEAEDENALGRLLVVLLLVAAEGLCSLANCGGCDGRGHEQEGGMLPSPHTLPPNRCGDPCSPATVSGGASGGLEWKS